MNKVYPHTEKPHVVAKNPRLPVCVLAYLYLVDEMAILFYSTYNQRWYFADDLSKNEPVNFTWMYRPVEFENIAK